MMKKPGSNYFILAILTLMFLAPGLAAYFFYQHPNYLNAPKVNKGTLLETPIHLTNVGAQNKWRLIYWSPTACDGVCLKQVDTLSRIRLALGRKLYEVDLWLMLGNPVEALNNETLALLKQYNFNVKHLSAEETNLLPAKSTLLIANPDSYVILSYSSLAKPDDIYKDLKLLLNNTTKKSE